MGVFSFFASFLLLLMPLLCLEMYPIVRMPHPGEIGGIFFIASIFAWYFPFRFLSESETYKMWYCNYERELLLIGRLGMIGGTAVQQYGFWAMSDSDNFETALSLVLSSHALLILIAATLLFSQSPRFRDPRDDWDQAVGFIYFVVAVIIVSMYLVLPVTVNTIISSATLLLLINSVLIFHKSPITGHLFNAATLFSHHILTTKSFEHAIWLVHLVYNLIIGLFLVDIYLLAFDNSTNSDRKKRKKQKMKGTKKLYKCACGVSFVE